MYSHLVVLLERELPLALIALFRQRAVRALGRLLAHLRARCAAKSKRGKSMPSPHGTKQITMVRNKLRGIETEASMRQIRSTQCKHERL